MSGARAGQERAREARRAPRPALLRPRERFPPSASLGTHRAAALPYRLTPLSPSPRPVPAMRAPQPPPPPGSPHGCGNARMLPLPAAPAHDCGRRARVRVRRGRAGGNARAGRVLEGTLRPRELSATVEWEGKPLLPQAGF